MSRGVQSGRSERRDRAGHWIGPGPREQKRARTSTFREWLFALTFVDAAVSRTSVNAQSVLLIFVIFVLLEP
jgi:hypothetical protein